MDLNQYLEYTRNTEMLLRTLSYIQSHRGKTVIIQICEDLIEEENYVHMILQDAVLLKSVGIFPVIVHSGPKENGKLPDHFSMVGSFSPEEKKLFFSMHALRLNKKMAGDIQALGENAIGIAGIDGDFIHTCRNGGEEKIKVNEKLIRDLLEKGYLPVIAAMCMGEENILHFQQAGEVSCAVGGCLRSDKIVFLGKCEGIYEDSTDSCTLIPRIRFGMLTDKYFPFGDRKAVGEALTMGVNAVKILDGRIPHGLLMDIFEKDGMGTSIVL